MLKKKLKIAIFSFTGDEGCIISLVELLNDHYKEWLPLLDFKYAKVLQSKNELKDIDVAFVEGAISTFREERQIKKIRGECKKIVALGSCAISGAPSNHRNFFNEEQTSRIKDYMKKFEHRPKVVGIHEIIKVDEQVPGCPMIPEQFIRVITKYLIEFGIIEPEKK